MKKRLGIIGLGNFGKFLLETYASMPELEVFGISSRSEIELSRIAKKYDIPKYEKNYRKLLANPEIDIISLPTPPFLHSEIILEAIKNRKDIICEKPLALNMRQAKKINSALKKSKSNFTINFVLRKNPITLSLKKLVDSKVLGNPQSFNFQNYAQTSSLPESHWFWDKKKSGGIWVEHGVHFFDLFSYLFGSSKLISSSSGNRPTNKKIEDFVSANFSYRNVIGNYTHSFTIPSQIEETSFKIVFDRGIVNVRGWIPESISIHGLGNKSEIEKIRGLFQKKDFKIKFKSSDPEPFISRSLNSKSSRFNFEAISKKTKDELYRDSIRDIARDLINSEKDRVSFDDAYNSLQTALVASKN